MTAAEAAGAPARARAMGEKISTKIARADGKPLWAFEVFPPKTSIGLTNLLDRLERMSSLAPSWLSVTWGAGGSTQQASLELAKSVIALGFDVCLHLTCTNMEKSVLDDTLEKAAEMGIANILALRGDPPRGDEYWVASDERFCHGSDLVRYIREKHGDNFCVGVAGYPEGHPDTNSGESDVDHLLEKQRSGAEFVITQLFYDVSKFVSWHKTCREKGITVPILPGIMPIQTYQSFRRMAHLCRSCIPDKISQDLQAIENDDSAVKEYGCKLASAMMEQLYTQGINVFHVCTLNLEKSTRRVLQDLGWAPSSAAKAAKENGDAKNGVTESNQTSKRANVPRKGSVVHWDDYPNGRFGDPRSPAYGDQSGWGSRLKIPAQSALKQWGHPVELADIAGVFTKFIEGKITDNPWSDEPLRPETLTISRELIRLNDERHWWTVGSQPAVDGVPSADPVHGFGPRGGYVYQKAFVEFFVTEADLKRIEERAAAEEARRRSSGEGEEGNIKYFAGNAKGERRSNMADGDVNAVTWGVFNARDIVTTTLIEEMSFDAWRAEAFEVWNDWASVYPVNSPSRALLQEVASTHWLVSVCHHDYKDETALWRWLLDEDS